MRFTNLIPVSSIQLDRLPINRQTLDLANFLEQGGTTPPIHVQRLQNGKWRILDGRHRVLAYKLLGRPRILARWGIQEPLGIYTPEAHTTKSI